MKRSPLLHISRLDCSRMCINYAENENHGQIISFDISVSLAAKIERVENVGD